MARRPAVAAPPLSFYSLGTQTFTFSKFERYGLAPHHCVDEYIGTKYKEDSLYAHHSILIALHSFDHFLEYGMATRRPVAAANCL